MLPIRCRDDDDAPGGKARCLGNALQTYEATLKQLEEAQSAKETEERQLHDKIMALREELKFKEDLITKLVPTSYRAKVTCSHLHLLPPAMHPRFARPARRLLAQHKLSAAPTPSMQATLHDLQKFAA